MAQKFNSPNVSIVDFSTLQIYLKWLPLNLTYTSLYTLPSDFSYSTSVHVYVANAE